MKEKQEKILEVKNLRISFKTNTGTVKAVRGIDFSLFRGRTLAIVGESGSGKSVTSKAILGILANNKIIEDGEILYDGKDLLSLPEHKFTKVRGVKISMIFQDPLSALNPIMKVGKQLTEAMYLEHKAIKKESKKIVKRFNARLEKINKEFNDETFKPLVEEEIPAFIKRLDDLKYAAEKLEERALKDKDTFDINVIKQEVSKIKKIIAKAVSILQQDTDDIIDVYVVLMKNYIAGYKNAIKLTKHREEIFAKFNVDSVFDIPAKYRTKEREVILDKEVYYQNMVKLTDRLIRHVEEQIVYYKNIDETFTESTIRYYKDNVKKMNSVLTAAQTKARAIDLMKEVGIPEPERRFYQYPFEFSGGMRQRIVIAIALSGNPEILICDEPTTALDVTIQAQILELINRLKAEKNLSIIFITHDLGVVANMADDIAVMYAGKIVEYGTVYDIFYDPRHPYTWALLGSMPDLDTKGKLDAIPGTPPNMLLPPRGDAFAARNTFAIALDYKQEPPFFQISETHYAKTWLAHKSAPDVDIPKTVKERIINSLKNNPANKPSYTLAKNSILETIKEEKPKAKSKKKEAK